jgi:hypothetical protein
MEYIPVLNGGCTGDSPRIAARHSEIMRKIFRISPHPGGECSAPPANVPITHAARSGPLPHHLRIELWRHRRAQRNQRHNPSVDLDGRPNIIAPLRVGTPLSPNGIPAKPTETWGRPPAAPLFCCSPDVRGDGVSGAATEHFRSCRPSGLGARNFRGLIGAIVAGGGGAVRPDPAVPPERCQEEDGGESEGAASAKVFHDGPAPISL